MIEVTFKTLVESLDNLRKVSEYKYLAETRYRMAKALLCVQQELAHYDKLLEPIMQKYGEQIGVGKYAIKREHELAYQIEVAELDAIIVKLPIDKLLHTNVENQIESPADIVALAWLIDFPELQIQQPEQPLALAG